MASCFESFGSQRRSAEPQGAGSKTTEEVAPQEPMPQAEQTPEQADEPFPGWPTVPMPEKVRAAWKAQLEENARIKDDGIKAAALARECHPLERFHVTRSDEKTFEIKVVFKDQGDTLPPEMKQRLEAYIDFLQSAKEDINNAANFDKSVRAFIKKAQLGLKNMQLQGAFFGEAHLQGLNCDGAQLQGAYFGHAQLQGANFWRAQLQGAYFSFAQLEGASFERSDLTNTVFSVARVTRAKFEGAMWSKEEPPKCSSGYLCKCTALSEIRFPKQKEEVAFLANLWRYWKSGEDSDDDEEAEEDEQDQRDDQGEENSQDERDNHEDGKAAGEGQGDDGDTMNAGADGGDCCVPLLNCGLDSWYSPCPPRIAEDLLNEGGMALAEAGAKKADEELTASANAAEKYLQQLTSKLDAAAKPQVALLLKMTKKIKEMESKAVKKLGDVKMKKLKDAMELLSKLPTAEKGMEAFNKQVDLFRKDLHEIEGAGISRMLTKIANAQLQTATGYSSGDLLAFLKCSSAKMARDARELEVIVGCLEKLQETVNANNWDDIIDNFMCLYDRRHQLAGERSRTLFKSIWRDEEFRKHIAVADLFQDVARVSDPPAFVVYATKQAAGHVKRNAAAWTTACDKEIAAINILKKRQDSFFQLIISGISGIFVFLATFLSGLVLDEMKAGKLSVPFVAGLLNSTNPS